jgi:hypothetical protein
MSLATHGEVAQVLLDYVEQNRTFRTEQIKRVPSVHYTDPERWSREMALIFKRVPLMLALTAELPNAGDYKAMTALGLPILITRGNDGIARAMLNVCAHRGAPVAVEGTGAARASRARITAGRTRTTAGCSRSPIARSSASSTRRRAVSRYCLASSVPA